MGLTKRTFLFPILFLLSFFVVGCSSDDEEEEPVMVSWYITVKDKESMQPISGVNVFLNGGISCSFYGCGTASYTWGKTDGNGEVILTVSEENSMEVQSVSCYKDSYHYYSQEIANPSSTVLDIFLVRFN